MAEDITLRGHHLLCLLTFIGKGYSPEFVENMEEIADRLTHGAPVRLVSGPDQICGPEMTRCGAAAHCHTIAVLKRDTAALRALRDGPGGMIGPFRLTAGQVAKMRGDFKTGKIRAACKGCDWYDLCTNIAANGYPGARLFPT